MTRIYLEKNIPLSLTGAEKIPFPPKPDMRTDGHFIINYRVDSILEIFFNKGEP